jgi:hypothetical protein
MSKSTMASSSNRGAMVGWDRPERKVLEIEEHCMNRVKVGVHTAYIYIDRWIDILKEGWSENEIRVENIMWLMDLFRRRKGHVTGDRMDNEGLFSWDSKSNSIYLGCSLCLCFCLYFLYKFQSFIFVLFIFKY